MFEIKGVTPFITICVITFVATVQDLRRVVLYTTYMALMTLSGFIKFALFLVLFVPLGFFGIQILDLYVHLDYYIFDNIITILRFFW